MIVFEKKLVITRIRNHGLYMIEFRIVFKTILTLKNRHKAEVYKSNKNIQPLI